MARKKFSRCALGTWHADTLAHTPLVLSSGVFRAQQARLRLNPRVSWVTLAHMSRTTTKPLAPAHDARPPESGNPEASQAAGATRPPWPGLPMTPEMREFMRWRGAQGGKARTRAKSEASVANGKRGGRPRKGAPTP
jgi:hypothetical protein